MRQIMNHEGGLTAALLRMAVVVSIALGAAGFYYLLVNMKSFTLRNPKRLELYYKRAKRFSIPEKEKFLTNHSGLWLYQSYALVGGTPLKKIDRLELKDNGIVWEVVEWSVKMPSGKETVLYQIRTLYVEPYGTMGNDTLCDAYTIHQSFITSNDTCFGGWNFVDLWIVRREGAVLVVARRTYEPYRGTVTDFFPRGMLNLVGMGADGGNSFFKKTNGGIEIVAPVQGIHETNSGSTYTNAMVLPDCLDMNSLSDVFKKELFAEYADRTQKKFNRDSAVVYLERYYQPLFIYEQLRFFPRPLPDAVSVSFCITGDGSLDSIKCRSPRGSERMFVNDMVREMQTWRFPQGADILPITYTFTTP